MRRPLFGRLIRWCGIVWTFLFVAVFCSLLSDGTADMSAGVAVFLSLVLTVLGVLVWRSGSRRVRYRKLLPEYTKRIYGNPDITVAALASSTGKSAAQVQSDLMTLHRYHCFKNSYIDKGQRCLAFSGYPRLLVSQRPGELVPVAESAPVVAVPGAQAASGAFVAVQCGGCGATNRVAVGTADVCEYCGTPISGRR